MDRTKIMVEPFHHRGGYAVVEVKVFQVLGESPQDALLRFKAGIAGLDYYHETTQVFIAGETGITSGSR